MSVDGLRPGPTRISVALPSTIESPTTRHTSFTVITSTNVIAARLNELFRERTKGFRIG